MAAALRYHALRSDRLLQMIMNYLDDFAGAWTAC
jgi:hypothetical protein